MSNLAIHKILWLLGLLIPPAANIFGSFSTGQRIFHALIAFAVLVVAFIWKSFSTIRYDEYINRVVIFAFCCCFYFTATTLVNSSAIQSSDIVEFIRPINYLLYFLLPVIVFLDTKSLEKLFAFLLWILLFQVLFSTLVFLPETWWLVDFYKGRMSTDDVIFHFYRFSGTFGYPSDFSFYLLFFMLFICFSLLGNVSRRAFFSMAALLLLATIGLFFTGSRSGLALFLIIFVVILFTHKLILKPSVFLIGVLITILLIYLFSAEILDENLLSSLLYLVDLVEKGVNDASARHRIKEFLLAIELMSDYFPFGFGANKDYFAFVLGPVESTYGYYMGKYGFIGITLYFSHIFYLSWVALRVSSLYRDKVYLKALANAFFLWALSVPFVFGFASAVTDRFRGPFLFYMIAGYLFALYINAVRQGNNGSDTKL